LDWVELENFGLGPGSLFGKIGLGLLLNKQRSQAGRKPSPKFRPIRLRLLVYLVKA
jgi:hypothetical protein